MFLRFYSYPYLILMILTVIPQLQFVNSFSLRNGMIQRMKINRKMVGTRLFQTNPLLMEQAMKERMKQLKISPNSTFLLNVSGGSDSMALFHMFRAIHAKYWKDMKLKVVNFNHKARKEADDEVLFVKDWCDRFGIEFFSREFPEKLRGTSNFQEQARKWRRGESMNILEGFENPSGKYIVTGHNREDQIETILLKILRGSFISNLTPMEELDGVFLKPIIQFRKEELRQYLMMHNFDWREDYSNTQKTYKRNMIRLELIPMLRDLAGGADALENRFFSLGEQSHLMGKYLDSQVTSTQSSFKSMKYGNSFILESGQPFEDYPDMLLSQVIFKWVEQAINVKLTYQLLREALRIAGKPGPIAVTLTGDWDMLKLGKELRIFPRGSQEVKNVSLFEDNSIVIKGNPNDFQVTKIDKTSTANSKQSSSYNYIVTIPSDPSNPQSYELRYVQPGDKFESMSRRAKIANILSENRVPIQDRDRVPLLVQNSENGKQFITNVLFDLELKEFSNISSSPANSQTFEISILKKKEPFPIQ